MRIRCISCNIHKNKRGHILATQTPLTTTNNDIHYITQESINLATQTPLTTTNNDIQYITQESITPLTTRGELMCCEQQFKMSNCRSFIFHDR